MLTRWRTLAPPVDVDGPRIRLGLAWAAVSVVACVVGPNVTAIVFAGLAMAAAGQSCRAWRREERRPYRPVAVAGAVLMALAGRAGPLAVGAAVVLVGIGSVVAEMVPLGGREWNGRLTAAIALVTGAAACAIPMARAELDTTAALVLLATVLVAEASAFVVGFEGRTSFDGPVAGAAAVAAMSLATAAVLVPPFRGASPWVLGAVVALLVPLGPRVASAVLPSPGAFAPALRRLDAFVVAGPVWAIVAAFMLDVR